MAGEAWLKEGRWLSQQHPLQSAVGSDKTGSWRGKSAWGCWGHSDQCVILTGICLLSLRQVAASALPGTSAPSSLCRAGTRVGLAQSAQVQEPANIHSPSWQTVWLQQFHWFRGHGAGEVGEARANGARHRPTPGGLRSGNGCCVQGLTPAVGVAG